MKPWMRIIEIYVRPLIFLMENYAHVPVFLPTRAGHSPPPPVTDITRAFLSIFCFSFDS